MHIVDSMHLDRREVQLGNTKVFIKITRKCKKYFLYSQIAIREVEMHKLKLHHYCKILLSMTNYVDCR